MDVLRELVGITSTLSMLYVLKETNVSCLVPKYLVISAIEGHTQPWESAKKHGAQLQSVVAYHYWQLQNDARTAT